MNARSNSAFADDDLITVQSMFRLAHMVYKAEEDAYWEDPPALLANLHGAAASIAMRDWPADQLQPTPKLVCLPLIRGSLRPMAIVLLDGPVFRVQVVAGGIDLVLGHRWESPEGSGDGASQHDFYHCQSINVIRLPGGTSTVPIDFGMSERRVDPDLPTICVDARDIVQMTDAMFVSLYGTGYLESWIRKATSLEHVITRRKVLEKATLCQWQKCRRVV